MNEDKNGIHFTVVYMDKEYEIRVDEEQYHSLMTCISDQLSIIGFGLCSGMGSCGTCLVEINGVSVLACEVPVNGSLTNARIKIDASRI
jgi:aerobic-type carbon monoxide dehydrogenase small subunit (CoxS/CutS family)